MTQHKIKQAAKILIVVLSIILLWLCFLLWRQYQAIGPNGTFRGGRFHFSTIMSDLRHRPLAVTDTGYIRPWMTFDYINTIFKLPKDYLKTELGITDNRYPRLSINQSARTSGQNPISTNNDFVNFVRAYLSSTSAPTLGQTATSS